MTLKEMKETSDSQVNNDNSLQRQIKQTRREIHEFLGLLGELAHEQADHTSSHYQKVIMTTLHSIPVITAQLETLNQSLERERLIHNDLYVQDSQKMPSPSTY